MRQAPAGKAPAGKATSPKFQRCAIYTRKSTEHNLDLTFNSLDAQREACEAYIKSQAHEGWRLIPGHFDDGGLSGASLDRPALQALLDEVRAKKIDIIVVYKVDRLTRSLADFAKLVELFDEYGVSFVSVTQSFNTTSSMGRLTLNVLLSFAQFEREVIGERVRDKIAASKRKGIWVGGPVPLGYRSKDKKLDIVPGEAELVRKIFVDYLRIGSIAQLAAALAAGGIKPKKRQLADGTTIAAGYFRVGPLAHLLKNRFYIGEVVYHGETHQGEHEAILTKELFEAVQQKLADQATSRKLKASESPYLLTGLLYDDRGNRMTPSHANKKGIRYRYYVSQAILQNRKAHGGTVTRVSAPDLEATVMKALRGHVEAKVQDAEQRASVPAYSDQKNEPGKGNGKLSDPELIHRHAEKIVLSLNQIKIVFRREEAAAEEDDDLGAANLETESLLIPCSTPQPFYKGIVSEPASSERIDAKSRDALLLGIARAHQWMEDLTSGRKQTLEEIAAEEHLAERYVRRLLQLAFLSPDIITAIDNGSVPSGLTLSNLTQALPIAWKDQERAIKIRNVRSDL